MLLKLDQPNSHLDSEYLDRCLCQLGQSRDESYFVELYNYYAGKVKSYLMRNEVAERDAEDLTKKIMLTVLRRSSTFDSTKESSSAWIFSIARNTWQEFYRGRPRIELDPNDEMLK